MSFKTIVLRFRDLSLSGESVDTVEEHRRVILQKGYVWWGWWKKSDERERWEELSRVSSGTPLVVGLYDRETSRFFSARLEECFFTRDEEVPSPEPESTPEYYRIEGVVAWFRFSRLDSQTQEEFEAEFGRVPVGNATFFAIRELGGVLHADSSPLSLGEVSIDSNVILHLSDLHFGADHAFVRRGDFSPPSLDAVITRDLRRLEIGRVGLLIISGDFTTRAETGFLFGEAQDFVTTLVRKLEIERNQIILVPGNHDIPLHQHESENYGHERMVKSFMRNVLDRKVEDFMELQRFRLLDGRLLEVLTINSVRLRSRDLMNFGFVQWPIYHDFLSEHPPIPGVLRIAVMHHHLVPAPKEEDIDPEYPGASMSLTIDAGAVIEGLQSNGFRIVLHGHQHYPGVARISRGVIPHDDLELKGLEEKLYCLAGGTAGASRYSKQLSANSYSLLVVEGDDVRVRCREYTPVSDPRDRFVGVLSAG